MTWPGWVLELYHHPRYLILAGLILGGYLFYQWVESTSPPKGKAKRKGKGKA